VSDRARLFVALDLPEPVVAALEEWRAPLLADERALRAVAPEALHATLCFLGVQPEAAIPPLGAVVEACAGRVGSASALALGAPLWLPRRRPRVLAIALDDRHGELTALQEGLLGALVDGGWHEPEPRPYLPHVTVARVRGGDGQPARTLPDAPPELVFDGAALTLYRSHLDPGGARYEALARAPLA
jgi:2'-5' RNA ligase